jgi:drug/metabolite transporter (DMT)-like permease
VYSAGMNLQEGAFVQGVTCQPDPCLTQKGSILRFAVLTFLFFTMLGGVGFLILFANRPYGIQVISIVIDTAAVALYSFSRNRNNMQPFLLSCPVVRRQIPLLIRRHLGFLVALFIIQTTALELRPKLPEYLITPRGTDPSLFAVILGVVFGFLAVVQILSNRSLLERAHISAQANAA